MKKKKEKQKTNKKTQLDANIKQEKLPLIPQVVGEEGVPLWEVVVEGCSLGVQLEAEELKHGLH